MLAVGEEIPGLDLEESTRIDPAKMAVKVLILTTLLVLFLTFGILARGLLLIMEGRCADSCGASSSALVRGCWHRWTHAIKEISKDDSVLCESVNERVNGRNKVVKYGASEGTRTLDLRFTKPMLYQLSYAGFRRDAMPAFSPTIRPLKIADAMKLCQAQAPCKGA